VSDEQDLNTTGGVGRNFGFVRGVHYTGHVENVKELRRSGQEEDAERLLLELVEATEEEAKIEQWGVAPWYYEQLAILYRKRGDPQREVEILERFARQEDAGGVMPPELLKRLDSARVRLDTFKTEERDG
jgi:hypothetical protein